MVFTLGHPNYLLKHSDETKLKISQNRKGKNLGQIPWCRGKKLSEAHKNNLSRSHAGKWNGVAFWTGKKMSLKTRIKMSEAHRGYKNYLWMGGKDSLNNQIRGSIFYRNWRNNIFLRDSYTCIECNNVGGDICAHHKKSFAELIKEYNIKTIEDAINCKELWDISNGATLCHECHTKTDNYLYKQNGR